jgi:hypothetical protein
MTEELRLYLEDLRKEDNSDAAFHNLVVRGIDLRVYNILGLATEVGTSLPTVERWLKGVNAPMPSMRIPVYKEIAAIVERMLDGGRPAFHERNQLDWLP